MKILLDTNVLGRFAQPTHPLHGTAIAAAELLISANHTICVVPQVLYEFWAIATRSASENGLGFSVEQAYVELQRIQSVFSVMRDERGILPNWQQLVLKHRVQGKQAHDTRLVAAMKRHGITHLLTFDTGDFNRYADIVLLDPAQPSRLP
jgi:predicted nucleic acid-binding protein